MALTTRARGNQPIVPVVPGRYSVARLPTMDGNADDVLTTNGSGTLRWDTGGGTAIIDGGNFDTGGSLVSTTTIYDGGEFT